MHFIDLLLVSLLTTFSTLPLCKAENKYPLREDVYRVLCPDRAPSVHVYRQQDITVRNRIQCVALCQQDERCSTVTFQDNKCSLMTGDESSCEERAPGEGSLERVNSSWCSHGGEHVSQDTCICPVPYAGKFCAKVVSNVELKVDMPEMYPHGEWAWKDSCQNGSYAAGMQLEIEPRQGDGDGSDDTAVDVIRFLCLQAWDGFPEVDTVTSRTTNWGDVWPKIYCLPNYWIVQFRLDYEPDQGNGDDTAVNGMEVVCRGPGMDGTSTINLVQQLDEFSTQWSSWSPSCPRDSAVCALTTKVQNYQGYGIADGGDDGAVTDAVLHCC